MGGCEKSVAHSSLRVRWPCTPPSERLPYALCPLFAREEPVKPVSGLVYRSGVESVVGSTAPWWPARLTAAGCKTEAAVAVLAAGRESLVWPLAAWVPEPSCLASHLGSAVNSCVTLTRYLTSPVFSFVKWEQ